MSESLLFLSHVPVYENLYRIIDHIYMEMLSNGAVTRQRSGQRLPIFEETLVIVRGRWNNAIIALAAR